MHQLHVCYRRNWTVWQLSQKLKMVRCQFFSRPQRGQSRNGIKVTQIGQAGTRLVMVSADEDGAQFARARSHLIGIGAIADDIAQVINLVVFGSRIQASLQRLKVGVDVRKNQYAQSSLQSSMRLNRQFECINSYGDAVSYGETRAQCPGAISSKGTAPAGRASFSTIASGRARSVFNVGIALMSPRV